MHVDASTESDFLSHLFCCMDIKQTKLVNKLSTKKSFQSHLIKHHSQYTTIQFIWNVANMAQQLCKYILRHEKIKQIESILQNQFAATNIWRVDVPEKVDLIVV